MPVSQSWRIFISYARRDGTTLAQRLQSDLTKKGFDAWLDTQRIGGGAVWSTQIEREIVTRQVMIALLSPGSYRSEICRSEQLLALDKGKRVIPLLAAKTDDRPIYLYARQYRDFTDDANYAVRLGELLADIRDDASATLPDTYRKTRVTYLTTPPRVANYLERPEALRALRDAVFAEDHRQPIALTALAGMGGIGKTVLAKALTEEKSSVQTFNEETNSGPEALLGHHARCWISCDKGRYHFLKLTARIELRQPLACRGECLEVPRRLVSRASKCAWFRWRAAIASSESSPTCSRGGCRQRASTAGNRDRKRRWVAGALRALLPPIFAQVFRPQVSDIAYHASPIPRLWPCFSSEGRTPGKETGSVFGAAGCCSTSAAVRCELSRLRMWESWLPSFV